MWFKKVPEELLTSLTNQLPFENENSQCFLLTTLLLKPIGPSFDISPSASSAPSFSEYLPIRSTVFAFFSVREMVGKKSDCFVDRESWNGTNRIEGGSGFAGFTAADDALVEGISGTRDGTFRVIVDDAVGIGRAEVVADLRLLPLVGDATGSRPAEGW